MAANTGQASTGEASTGKPDTEEANAPATSTGEAGAPATSSGEAGAGEAGTEEAGDAGAGEAAPEHPVVYVLRHGETEWSLTGKHTGRTDVPLTVKGEQQARRAGLILSHLRGTVVPPALVLCSPRERARHTAGLAGLDIDEVTDELAEWDYGDYEGLTTPEIRERVPDWTVWTHPVPGGESADEVGARARSLLERITEATTTGDVILVGHGHFSRVLIASWLGEPATAGVRFALDPAGTTVLGAERGEHQVVRSNMPPWSI